MSEQFEWSCSDCSNQSYWLLIEVFSHVQRDSICHFVGPLVGRSVCPAFAFSAFASGFRITAPAQSYGTDVVMYTAPLTPHASYIIAHAHAQVYATKAVKTNQIFL